MRKDVTKFGEISELEPRISRFIKDRNIYVLRDKKTGIALNVSYTPDGLTWTTNVRGKLICFKDAKFERTYDAKYNITKVSIVGDKRLSDDVYIEKFTPTNHRNLKNQIAEYTWVDKAYHLLTLNAGAFEA